MNLSKIYIDELSFSIAHSPLGDVPPIEVMLDNVFNLYEIDESIQYSDIIDYENELGNYYSTIRYKVLQNNTEIFLEYPKEIYYWYVVHPELLGGNAKHVYGKLWRYYLFNHNDIGYPLLREKLSNIFYLWDCKSYNQYDNRIWNQCIKEHPTAIEAISYWIGKTVPYGAMGDRPSQPNLIAHEHNGWCGELQRIAVAALRTALIPCVGVSNIAEDHVWREFYERGWHQNDNWWTDSGGAVDRSDVYGYDWGKDMSSIYAWNGDGSIYEVTSTYIHPEDRVKVCFEIKDIFMQPVDGALVTVFVKGLRDITWYKNKIWEKIEEIWSNLPLFIKGKILQNTFDRIKTRFQEIPDVIDGATITIWNYSDTNGKCTFDLGRNDEYLFLIQTTNLNYSWPISKRNAIRTLSNPKDDIIFKIIFTDLSNRIQLHKITELPDGEYLFDISFKSKSYQLQKNIRNGDIGIYEYKGKIDFFVLDEENFALYKNNKKFNCFNFLSNDKSDISFSSSKEDLYIVFRNNAKRTSQVLDFSILVKKTNNIDLIQIVRPNTNLFEYPIFNVGDNINISGISTNNINLIINNEEIDITVINNEWFYIWNTSGLLSGEYSITANCGNVKDDIIIELIDVIPPVIKINNPRDKEIFEEEIINIRGKSSDNSDIDRVEIAIDNGDVIQANGVYDWFIDFDVSLLEPGLHTIYANAFDKNEIMSKDRVDIIINDSNNYYKPQINDIYHEPIIISNNSNVVIYANVTSKSSFNIKEVMLYYCINDEISSYKMYMYGNNPQQERHEEDPLINKSNKPLFGIEIGHFSSKEKITYFVIAYDEANNSIKSIEKTFTVQ